MSRFSAPLLHNGFSFEFPQLAEDGLPFSLWDKSTVYKKYPVYYPDDDLTKPPVLVPDALPESITPSKSSSKLITVYGEDSIYCLKLSLDQLAELYWRAAWMKFSVDTDATLEGNASITTTFTDQSNNTTETLTVSASMSSILASEMSCYIPGSSTTPPVSFLTYKRDGYIGRVAGHSELHLFPVTEARLINSWMPVSGGYPNDGFTIAEDESYRSPGLGLNAAAYKVNDDETKSDTTDNYVYASIAGNFALDFRDAVPRVDGNRPAFNMIPKALNVIQVGPNEFYFDPGCNAELVARAVARGGEDYSGMDKYMVSGGAVSNFWETPFGTLPADISYKGCFPIKLKLSGSTISGNYFGCVWSVSLLGNGGAGGADASVGNMAAPVVTFAVTKWWPWADSQGNALWDENTGARL